LVDGLKHHRRCGATFRNVFKKKRKKTMSKIDKLGFFIDDNARPIVVGLVIVILILLIL
jgi:hypothetical protein